VIAWTQRLTGDSGPVTLALTDRAGGCSRGPYAAADGSGGLNLAAHVDDDPDDVSANRAALANAVGLAPDRLVVADQVHGRDVVQVTAPWPGPPPAADALVTTVSRLALVVLVADCVPVLLAAPGEGVVAVAHAGRSGMTAGVVAAAVDAMRDLGAREIVARVGPSVCPRCYPVPLDLREQVATVEPVSRSVAWDGRPSVDVAAGVLAQLARLGVAARQLPGCTVESPGLYSYRRDGRTGRFAGLVWRAAGEAA
jgi:polyphenol oxidase